MSGCVVRYQPSLGHVSLCFVVRSDMLRNIRLRLVMACDVTPLQLIYVASHNYDPIYKCRLLSYCRHHLENVVNYFASLYLKSLCFHAS